MTKDAHEKANAELKRLENMPPMSAESTVSRNYLDWLLAVPWKKKSKEIRDLKFAQQVLEIRSLRPGEDQRTHPGIPGRPAAGAESQGLHSLLCRTSRRRQDLARNVHRQSHRAQVRPAFARRRARRGRNPRPSPHLHRRAARPDHSDDEEGRHCAIPCSCWTKSTRCRWTSAAILRPRCSRCWIRNRTTCSWITIWTSNTI